MPLTWNVVSASSMGFERHGTHPISETERALPTQSSGPTSRSMQQGVVAVAREPHAMRAGRDAYVRSDCHLKYYAPSFVAGKLARGRGGLRRGRIGSLRSRGVALSCRGAGAEGIENSVEKFEEELHAVAYEEGGRQR